jgi:hypothetical protein
MNNFMSKRILRWVIICSSLLIILFLLRHKVLFSFQKIRLQQLGCAGKDRLLQQQALGSLTPCQKLWVHRVNSLERLNDVKDDFAGVEADVVYDDVSKEFRVHHPPALAGKLTSGDYFRILSGQHKFLWLDVKGLGEDQFIDALESFEKSEAQYKISKWVVIESSEMKFANLLALKGFITSYLVPVELLENERQKKSFTMKNELSPDVRFVSGEDTYIDQLKASFPDQKILLWAISFKNYVQMAHLNSLINDTTVNAVLINIKTSNYK